MSLILDNLKKIKETVGGDCQCTTRHDQSGTEKAFEETEYCFIGIIGRVCVGFGYRFFGWIWADLHLIR